MNTHSRTSPSTPELGIKVHNEIRSILASEKVTGALRKLSNGEAALGMTDLLPDWLCSAVLADLETDAGWNLECWELKESSEVVPIAVETFLRLGNAARFSINECLRKPAKDAYCLRGFLSALTSVDVSDALSKSFGEKVKFKSADMARYSEGHYLRRHADIFEDRRFGFVWFFGNSWTLGDGGELIVESSAGNSIVIPPKKGTVAALLIRPDYFHQVAENISLDWIRFSVASHYHAIHP